MGVPKYQKVKNQFKQQTQHKSKVISNHRQTFKGTVTQHGEIEEDKKVAKNQVIEEKKRIKKQKFKNKKKREEQEHEDDAVEAFDQEGYFIVPKNIQVSQEDEEILKQFSILNTDLTNQISQSINQLTEQKKQQSYKENILNNPKVKIVYSDIAQLLKTYRSGKLARAFQIIPQLEQWDEVLELTQPSEWSNQAILAATKCFTSGLDIYRAKIFFERYLLPAVRQDIQKNKKLNVHLYNAIKKALYKPAAWFKGLLFPLITSPNTTIKEAEIIGSIVHKMSIPAVHSSVAILKLLQLDYTGPIGIILKMLIEKQYSLPNRVIQSLVQYFRKFQNDKRQLPVIWHQSLLSFCQLYRNSLDEMQKESLIQLIKKKKHHLISDEILKAINNIPSKLENDIKQQDVSSQGQQKIETE